jgi:neutral ceramidase
MKAGYAKACVTPPLGLPMEGLGQQGGIQSIHDDLYVRALYLSHGGEEVLILGCDLLFFTRAQMDRVKGAIGRAVDLTPRQIFHNFSHTHAGPRLTTWSYSGEVEPLYFEQIEAAFVQAAIEAKAAPTAVTMEAGMTRTDVPVSRRKLDAEGKASWAPMKSAAICDALPITLFKDAEGKVVCLLFSVSCHPSTWYELDVSADYPGVATDLLNAHFDTDGALFLQGCGGDTKPYTVAVGEDHWRHGKWEDVEQAGKDVAEAVIARVAQGLTPVEPDLTACLFDMQWQLEPIPPRASYEEVANNPAERKERRIWAEDMLARLSRFGSLPQTLPVALHGVKLGAGLRLVGMEGETVAEIGTLMLDYYKTGTTFPMGYTNGSQVYLTVSHMRDEGSYEVDSFWEYHLPSPLAVGMERTMLEALDELKACGIE